VTVCYDLFCSKSWLPLIGEPLMQVIRRNVQQMTSSVAGGHLGRFDSGIDDRKVHTATRSSGRLGNGLPIA
jgi:hypothetical protein